MSVAKKIAVGSLLAAVAIVAYRFGVIVTRVVRAEFPAKPSK